MQVDKSEIDMENYKEIHFFTSSSLIVRNPEAKIENENSVPDYNLPITYMKHSFKHNFKSFCMQFLLESIIGNKEMFSSLEW